MSNRPPVKTILILAANPIGKAHLRLDEEVREIDTGLRLARQRDQFVLHQKWAVRPEDIRRALFDTAPQIIHFCGHGEGEDGLIVENRLGKMQLVPTQALADLFELFNDVECVLLNACYSEKQAEAISQHIPYVIGMSKTIGDRAAIEFAIGFYDALGNGRSYEEAYRFGCNAIDLHGIPEERTPKMKRRLEVSASTPQNLRPPFPEPVQSVPRKQSQPKKSAPSRSRTVPQKSGASSPNPLLRLSQKTWTFLLPIIVIWGFVGVTSTLLKAPSGQMPIGLLVCGAIGGGFSGLFSAIAQRKIRPSVQLEQILLHCIVGTIAGAVGWLLLFWLVEIFIPGSFIGNGFTFGVIAGLVAVALTLWQISRSRA